MCTGFHGKRGNELFLKSMKYIHGNVHIKMSDYLLGYIQKTTLRDRELVCGGKVLGQRTTSNTWHGVQGPDKHF